MTEGSKVSDFSEIEKMIAGLTTDEASKLRANLQKKLAQDEIEKRLTPGEYEKVEDFNDSRVEPFSPNCYYTVYNYETNRQFEAVAGNLVNALFPTGDENGDRVKFGKKMRGSEIVVDGKQVRFSFFEINPNSKPQEKKVVRRR